MSNITLDLTQRTLIGAADAEHNLVQIFDERKVLGKQFCMYGSPDEPLFLAKDVAYWIEHSNARMMLQGINEDEKVCVNNPYALKGQQEQWFVTEDGLYEILMQSRKPIAKEFKRQVKEILKTIRKTGVYAVKPMTQVEILQQTVTLLAEQEKQLQQIAKKQDRQAEQLKSIRDIVSLNPFDNWRDSTTSLINRIVEVSVRDYDKVRSESYKLLNDRLRISLIRRLKNRQKAALLNGATKSSAEQINYLDVIAEDKKLIEGYVAIVKDMAIKYGA